MAAPVSRRRLVARISMSGLVLLLAAAAAALTFFAREVSRVEAILKKSQPLALGEEVTVAAPGAPRTILLMGSDRRYQDGQLLDARSDTMILVRLDPDNPVITTLSIPRDLRVSIRTDSGREIRDRINRAYSLGGPRLAVKTIKRTLGVNIHHVVIANFGGFQRLVDQIGCVYTDIDRRYFNRNLGTAETNYANIDIQPGYQKLCGKDALAYVRYRHSDNDLVRAARQNDFLRQAKQQMQAGQLFEDRDQLLRLLVRYTQTDIRERSQILALIRLAVFSSGKPVRQIPFPGQLDGAYVSSTPAQLRRAAKQLLHPKPPARSQPGSASAPAAKPKQPRRSSAAKTPYMEDARRAGRQEKAALRAKTSMPVLYPARRLSGSVYVDPPRAYRIRASDGSLQPAYRMVLRGPSGGYYGVQGTAWTQPPILASPDETRSVNGKTLLLFYEGRHLRLVGYRTPTAAYWVSNTLTLSVGNRQMLATAASLTR